MTEINRKASVWRRFFERARLVRLSATDRAIIGAQGKLLAMLVAELQSGKPFDAKRFAEMLILFGTLTSEEDRQQGQILAIWGDTVRESLHCAAAVAPDRSAS